MSFSIGTSTTVANMETSVPKMDMALGKYVGRRVRGVVVVCFFACHFYLWTLGRTLIHHHPQLTPHTRHSYILCDDRRHHQDEPPCQSQEEVPDGEEPERERREGRRAEQGPSRRRRNRPSGDRGGQGGGSGGFHGGREAGEASGEGDDRGSWRRRRRRGGEGTGVGRDDALGSARGEGRRERPPRRPGAVGGGGEGQGARAGGGRRRGPRGGGGGHHGADAAGHRRRGAGDEGARLQGPQGDADADILRQQARRRVVGDVPRLQGERRRRWRRQGGGGARRRTRRRTGTQALGACVCGRPNFAPKANNVSLRKERRGGGGGHQKKEIEKHQIYIIRPFVSATKPRVDRVWGWGSMWKNELSEDSISKLKAKLPLGCHFGVSFDDQIIKKKRKNQETLWRTWRPRETSQQKNQRKKQRVPN